MKVIEQLRKRVLREDFNEVEKDDRIRHIYFFEEVLQVIVEFELKSIVKIDTSRKPIYANQHVLGIRLPARYPLEIPRLHMLTDIWHPNVKHDGPFAGQVLINNPQELVRVFNHKGNEFYNFLKYFADLLQYKNYFADLREPPYPEDMKVAKWVKEYGEPTGVIEKKTGIPREVKTELIIEIDQYFDEFTFSKLESTLEIIQQKLKKTSISIKDIQPGSIKITIELGIDDFNKLLSMNLKGELEDLVILKMHEDKVDLNSNNLFGDSVLGKIKGALKSRISYSVDSAFEHFKEILIDNTSIYDEFIYLQNRYSRNRRTFIQGKIPYEVFDVEMNKICNGMILLVNKISLEDVNPRKYSH